MHRYDSISPLRHSLRRLVAEAKQAAAAVREVVYLFSVNRVLCTSTSSETDTTTTIIQWCWLAGWWSECAHICTQFMLQSATEATCPCSFCIAAATCKGIYRGRGSCTAAAASVQPPLKEPEPKPQQNHPLLMSCASSCSDAIKSTHSPSFSPTEINAKVLSGSSIQYDLLIIVPVFL